MIMNAASILSLLTRLAVTACVTLTLSAIAHPAHAQAVVVMVNGDPVTTFDIEQRSKLIALTTHKTPARQDVIQELIDDRLKIKEAKKFGVDLSASDTEETYAGMAS